MGPTLWTAEDHQGGFRKGLERRSNQRMDFGAWRGIGSVSSRGTQLAGGSREKTPGDKKSAGDLHGGQQPGEQQGLGRSVYPRAPSNQPALLDSWVFPIPVGDWKDATAGDVPDLGALQPRL